MLYVAPVPRYEAPVPRVAPSEQYPAPRDPQGRALGLDPTWLHMKKFQQGQAQPGDQYH